MYLHGKIYKIYQVKKQSIEQSIIDAPTSIFEKLYIYN